MVTVRFAPSPTGYLHLGNLRTAILNWLFSQKNEGKFYLRFDDTDTERSKDIYTEQIIHDFAKMHINIDGIYKQSENIHHYEEVFHTLLKNNHIYACYETTQELDIKRKKLQSRGKPPIYDRASLQLSQKQIQEYKADGRRPYYRFQLSPQNVSWHDGIRGLQKISLNTLSDPVIRRADGSFLYTFTSVIDDINLNITHIIRGEDHVTNTAIQIDMFNRISNTVPIFAHHNLLTSSTGEGLSKRLSSLSVKDLLEQGFESDVLLNYVAHIGSSQTPNVNNTIQSMIDNFTLSRYSRSSSHTNIEEIRTLNAQTLQILSDDEIKNRLTYHKCWQEDSLALWHAVKANCILFSDLFEMINLAKGVIEPQIVNQDYCQKAINALPEEPWNPQSFKQWTKDIASLTGYKGKSLFMPLRLALTGKESGPELSALFQFIAKDKIIKRLSGIKA